MICPECNSEVKDNALFCGKCGHKFEKQESPAAAPSVQSESNVNTPSGNVLFSEKAMTLRVVLSINSALLGVLMCMWMFVPYFSVTSSLGAVENGASLFTQAFYTFIASFETSYGSASTAMLLLVPIYAVFIAGICSGNVMRTGFLTRKHNFVIPIICMLITCIFAVILMVAVQNSDSFLSIMGVPTYANTLFVALGLISIALMAYCQSLEKELLTNK